MTVYKAFRNFYIFLISAAILLGAAAGGAAAYVLYDKQEQAEYALSKYGSTGSEVRNIQQKLKSLGYYGGSVDGIYGTQTQNAVRSFQRSVGITVDGIAGPQTLLYMGLGGSSSGGSSLSGSDVQLIARVISAEARGESYTGQVAVGAVDHAHFEPRFLAVAGGAGKLPHRLMNVLHAHLLRGDGGTAVFF